MFGRKSSAKHSKERLVSRRRHSRRRATIALIVLFVFLVAVSIWGVNQSSVLISRVQIYVPISLNDPNNTGEVSTDNLFSEFANQAMQGSYFGIIPRNSTFFFPAYEIRKNILSSHPEIAAVSIFRNGLTGISIKINYRVPVARWCPSSSSVSTSNAKIDDCYFFDVKGFVYATTTNVQAMNSFIVYEPIKNGNPIIGSILPNASEFPSAFDFARQVSAFGSPVLKIAFRDDEIDDYLASGTRITYVLGDEQNAFTALSSARSNINLTDGSVEYIDLRFVGKIYIKKK